MSNEYGINIVFDGPPGPESGRFVEVEDEAGRSVSIGTWTKYRNGQWALRITASELKRHLRVR